MDLDIRKGCVNVDYGDGGVRALRICHTYFLLKALDLLDTVRT